MHTIAIRLDPRLLANPDADIRYKLPDLIVRRSNGTIVDGGYDYCGNPPYMVMFLATSQLEPAIQCILQVIQEPFLNNDLRPAIAIAIEQDNAYDVIHPAGLEGEFLPKDEPD